ncbi:protein phosphatase 2C domain-containing protein [Streptomyces sp. DSM 42041]|uniref:Protein phosphatase 2C domain-containing protein n=1 Tax=Streptomyces hazeniae TaxID=3075538 RepID=A0ABU2NMD2_9ACTN|nr:protein phosphatase 2C domain-containing protein [Streptomyces sp. DSM 42041]MDT0378131.1 protein phosphatase 2C domain-containing protein [Streptomyces sp. DSM 42041]
MRVETASEPGTPTRPNEDHVSLMLPASGRGGAFVVLDGVTPPEGDVGCAHGVPWYVGRLGGALLELAGSRREMTLAECLAEAVARTARAHRSTCDLSHPRTPQATVVAARWDEESVEYLVLSDSVLLVEGVDGSVRAVRDTRLDALPPGVTALREAARALPSGSPERATAAAEYVAAVEALRNAPDGTGFHTAATDPAVAALAVTGTVPRDGVRALLGLTDGASRWSEVFRAGDWADLCALVHKEGPAGLIARVRAAEEADPAGRSFPRGKPHDDATAVLVELPDRSDA